MNQKPELNELEKLNQLSKKELVKMILTQQQIIEQLSREIEKLKASRELDSKTSSKPPSSDLLKKSEKKKEPKLEKKKKPGGQPGHEGKTRKGFGRVDRYEVLRASNCYHCGQNLASFTIRKTARIIMGIGENRNLLLIREYQRP